MNTWFRTILVQLDLGEACAIRVSLAAAIAQTFDSHLVGLHTAPPADVRLNGDVLEDAQIDLGHDLQLSWRRLDGTDSVAYVDVRGSSSHRCAFADVGSAVLPREVVATLDRTQGLTLSLHRVAERSGRVRNTSDEFTVDSASVVFDLARTFHVSVR
mgnify:CR=1 FL=1